MNKRSLPAVIGHFGRALATVQVRKAALAGILSFPVFLLLIALPVYSPNASVFEPREFGDPAQAARYRTLIEELRCLVCQNQSLADSNAELAVDLREEIYRMVSDGTDEESIKTFMVSRYSEYVLYRPPVNAMTLLLWIGPSLFVLIGGGVLVLRVRRRNRVAATGPLSETEEKKIRELLELEP